MAEVDILMAAYNGEKYIAEQIESILAQTFQDFRLIIRDDGSSDNTPAIIEAYAAKYPGKVEIVYDDAVCKNPSKNFFQLMKHAKADYAMFSDQDDYWLPYKVQISLDYMKNAEKENPEKPLLVFTGLEVVDAHLRSMNKFMALAIPKTRYDMMPLLMANCVTGCTEIFNRVLYENIGDYSEAMLIHDHWLALYACACGALCSVPMALMLYRQHDDNSIGYIENVGGLLHKIRRKVTEFLKAPISIYTTSREIFYRDKTAFTLFRTMYCDQILPDKLRDIDLFLKLWSDSKLTRIKTFFEIGYPYVSKLESKLLIILKMLIF